MRQSMVKRLIINADDFGLTRGINYGIVDSYLNKSVSSISLMVNAPQSNHAIVMMNKFDLDCVGVHVNITLGRPIADPKKIPSLIDESGQFHKSSWWIANKAVESELILEFDCQIELFQKLTGKMPKHINYHHRNDLYSDYPGLFVHLVEKYDVPMRLEADDEIYIHEYARNMSYFHDNGAKLSEYLIGEIIEMPCHIGFVDHELMNISSLNLGRMNDYMLVNSQEFKDCYRSLGYILVGFDAIHHKRILQDSP